MRRGARRFEQCLHHRILGKIDVLQRVFERIGKRFHVACSVLPGVA